MKNLFQKPLKFLPNLRIEKADAKTGYIWGKPAAQSNILTTINSEFIDLIPPIQDRDVVAERWIVSDDQKNGSKIITRQGKSRLFSTLLKKHGRDILGPKHWQKLGPFLNCIMKLIDTNTDPRKGSLSVQLHPPEGDLSKPSKPEMWKGNGHVYLGWKQNVTPTIIAQAHQRGDLESLLNKISLNNQLVLVKGALVHAIRANSFLAEWSKAPGQIDQEKGDLQDATIALYDRTDGKTPRPGKENLSESLKLLKKYQAFKQNHLKDLFCQAKLIRQKENFFQEWRLFSTAAVEVREIRLQKTWKLDIGDYQRGLPIYLESGEVEIFNQNQEKIDHLIAGDERFVPFALKVVIFKAVKPGRLQTWWRPF